MSLFLLFRRRKCPGGLRLSANTRLPLLACLQLPLCWQGGESRSNYSWRLMGHVLWGRGSLISGRMQSFGVPAGGICNAGGGDRGSGGRRSLGLRALEDAGGLSGFLHPSFAFPSRRHHPWVGWTPWTKEEDLGLMELQRRQSTPRDAGALGRGWIWRTRLAQDPLAPRRWVLSVADQPCRGSGLVTL